MDSDATADVTANATTWEDLPADALRSVVEVLDAPSLARLRCTNSNGRSLVDGVAADLRARHMHECRQRVARRSTVVARGSDGASSFVAIVKPKQPMHLWGGMCCGGPHGRRSLHRHSLLGGSGSWAAASYCGRQALLVRSDGVLVGDGPGIRGTDVHLECVCDADRDGEDGAEADGADADEDDDPAVLEQEEEARSRGWAFRKREEVACLGCGSPDAPVDAKLVSLPEAATHVCACPGRSFVLGTSGAIYSARWLGASSTPSASPWTRWAPAAGERVVEISALTAHVLLRTAGGQALAFGDPCEGKLGFAARVAWVGTPRVVDALAAHSIVGVAAGARHSLFLTHAGECFAAGSNHAGQCGPSASPPLGLLRRMRLPASCAPLVQVCAGHAFTLLLGDDGRVHACGLNDRGQCGIETLDSSSCVVEPTLISGLPPAVRAMEAGPSLAAFEVDVRAAAHADSNGDGGGGGGGGGDGGDGGDGKPGGSAARDAGDDAGADTSLWLAGNVEAFNIPGTNYTQPTGLRFLASCYQWQNMCSRG